MDEQVVPLREYRRLLHGPPAVLAIVALQLLVDYFAVPILLSLDLSDPAEGFVVCALFGGMMGQLALLVGYQAWGRDHWLRRWAKSAFLGVLCWAAFTAGAISAGNSFEVSSIAQLLGLVMAGIFVCLTFPTWGARWLLGLRFDLAAATPHGAAQARSQFQLRDLFVVTLAAAVVFGILKSAVGREILDEDWSISRAEVTDLATFLSLMTALCALAAVPAAWFALGKHRWGVAFAGLAAYLAAVVTVERFVYYIFDDRSPAGWLIVGGLNAGVVAQVLFAALLLRACGYRLRLRGPRKSAA